MIDILDLAKWAVIAFFSAVLAFWLWYTKVYEPGQAKRQDSAATQSYKIADSTQEFTEGVQTDALQAVLTIQAQLITHLIESNNGHMSKLTEAVMQGDKEHTAQLEKMTAAYNQALVTLSRAAAFPTIQRMADRPDIDNILDARVKTEAVQETDTLAQVAAASVQPPAAPNEGSLTAAEKAGMKRETGE